VIGFHILLCSVSCDCFRGANDMCSAASLGDLTTLALLAALSKLVFMVVEGET